MDGYVTNTPDVSGLRVTKETNKLTRKWTVRQREGLHVVEKEVESFKNEHRKCC